MAQLPTQSQFGDYSDWPGRDVLDRSGERLGGVREIYLDRETGRPEWVLVDVDGSEARFVPLANADVEAQQIRVAHDADTVKRAPSIGAEPRIDESEERRLYAYYGLGYTDDESGSGLPSDDAPAPTGWGEGEAPAGQARGGDTSSADQPTESFTPPSEADPPAGVVAPPESGAPTTAAAGDAEPTNEAPPPAEPPSPSELEAADIPDEPPAASDRAAEYGTAPFGAVSPPDEPPALEAGDEPPALAPAPDGPSTLTPPATTLGATDESTPPMTADTPEADVTGTPLTPHAAPPEPDPAAEKPSWASSPPPVTEPTTPPATLQRVKREPKKVALAAGAAALLFLIVRRLR